jgi:hypothetical protein
MSKDKSEGLSKFAWGEMGISRREPSPSPSIEHRAKGPSPSPSIDHQAKDFSPSPSL